MFGCGESRRMPKIDSSYKTISKEYLSKEIGMDIDNAPYLSFVVLPEADMNRIIRYLDFLFFTIEIKYHPGSTDCKDFADLKSRLARVVIQQSNLNSTPPAIFCVRVNQVVPFAGVPEAPMHALVLYAVSTSNGVKLRMWEPQGSTTTSISLYPKENTMVSVFLPPRGPY